MDTASARYRIIHETTYRYETPVSISRQHLHLTPRDCAWQSCLEHAIEIDPIPGMDDSRLDCFGNPVRQFAIESPHDSLRVCATSLIEVRTHLPVLPFDKSPAANRKRLSASRKANLPGSAAWAHSTAASGMPASTR